MSATHRLLKFGVFELNLDTQEMRKFGTPLKLPPQPFRLLALLASRAGQIVTREEIQEQIWGGDTYVDFEHGMNKCVKQIRTALGDDVNKPVYIETIPRQGYRFLAPVVAKTVLAPAPRVKEASSGIPPDLAEMIRARMAAKKTGTAEPAPAPALEPTAAAVAAERSAAPTIPTIATPQSPGRDWRWIALVALVIVVLLAWGIYGHFH
jgi:DNA-binding winged helix-turn-helix (wHTH) protein